jgi:hypothetical protein
MCVVGENALKETRVVAGDAVCVELRENATKMLLLEIIIAERI